MGWKTLELPSLSTSREGCISGASKIKRWTLYMLPRRTFSPSVVVWVPRFFYLKGINIVGKKNVKHRVQHKRWGVFDQITRHGDKLTIKRIVYIIFGLKEKNKRKHQPPNQLWPYMRGYSRGISSFIIYFW